MAAKRTEKITENQPAIRVKRISKNVTLSSTAASATFIHENKIRRVHVSLLQASAPACAS